jgi:hypothetical protein
MRFHLYAVTILVVIAAGPALAQTTSGPAGTGTTTAPQNDRDDGFDWGLLGLLGLAGLAPLFMRKDRQGNVHADTRR